MDKRKKQFMKALICLLIMVSVIEILSYNNGKPGDMDGVNLMTYILIENV